MGKATMRTIVLVGALCFALSLCACSNGGATTASGSSTQTSASATASASAQASSGSKSTQAALPILSFQTKDVNGNAVSSADFSEAKVILVNLWEPWCGPCVSELPALQKLYDRYRDQGLVILGAFTTTEEQDDVLDLVDKNGITYPIIVADGSFAPYQTRYVPTSMLFDGQGRPLLDEPVIGAQSYAQWEKLVLSYLQ